MEPVFIRKPTDEERALLESQPIWEHEVATWDTVYDEREETCLVVSGHAIVTTRDGVAYSFGSGDLVTFASGLDCTWSVVEDISKHCIFDMNK